LTTPWGGFFFPPSARFVGNSVKALGGRERKGREEREKEMEDTVHVTVGIHTSGGQRKWLLSSDPSDLLNVFRLPEINFFILELMTLFSSYYPSTSWKVCVDMLVYDRMCECNHNTTDTRV